MRSVYAEGGYGTKIADAALDKHGVRYRTIPRRGNPAPRPGHAQVEVAATASGVEPPAS